MKKVTLAVAVFCLAMTISSNAQTFNYVDSFNEVNGNAPASALIQGTDGYLYGATTGGGSENCNSTWQFFTGCGTVYKSLIGGGAITPVHIFCSETNCLDGALPLNVIQATDGNFYGTAYFGGADLAGSFFKISPNGELTVLHSFCSALYKCAYAYVASPNGVIQGRDGNFYGTTIEGSANNNAICNGVGCGTLFKVTSAGKFTTLYNFCSLSNCSDGAIPNGLLLQAENGNFYGATGGDLNVENGPCEGPPCGTIFEITPAGKLTTLYSFCLKTNCPDGATPTGSLVQAANGNLYGTTFNPGTVFEITPAGKLKTLYRFCQQESCLDGKYPSPLVLGSDGNFYGTTQAGGGNTDCSTGGYYSGCGTIFQITSAGQLTTLYNFCSLGDCGDGYIPVAALAQGTDGNFYGTTEYGGNGTCVNAYHYGTGCGVVFYLTTGLGPFVEASPNFGKASQVVNILGNSLSKITSVTFNGTSAKFKLISPYLLKAEVPTGATTGTIEVTTPSGTLNSNIAFQVLP
jgi:uncharacterized repeat protein (TIGR03803 family)